MKLLKILFLIILFFPECEIVFGKSHKDGITITIDSVYSDQYPEGNYFIGMVFLNITVINRSDSVVTVYMPEIPPPPPSERDGFDCYGIFRSDTLELGTIYSSLILEPNTLESRQYIYGNGKLDTLYEKYGYPSPQKFLQDLVRESRYYFIFDRRDTCMVESDSTLEIQFLGRFGEEEGWVEEGEWIEVRPLRKEKLRD